MTALKTKPYAAVVFAQHHLRDVPLACELANTLAMDSDRAWSDPAKAYEKVDAVAVLPIYSRLVHRELETANTQNYGPSRVGWQGWANSRVTPTGHLTSSR